MAGEIIHWNICGLKSKKSQHYKDKIDTLSALLERIESTLILNIQETHISKKEELPNIIRNYKHLYNFQISNAPENDTYSGIILGIRKTERIISSEILENGRLIFVKVQNEGSNIVTHIFSIYCNPSNSEKQKSLISKMKDKIRSGKLDNILILGDFNFVASVLDRNSQTLNRTDLETKMIWDPFENECALHDCFRLTNPNRRLYTYLSKNNKKIKSRIDRIFISANLTGKVLSSRFIQNNASDHKIIKVKLANYVNKGPGLWVFNNTLLEDNEYIDHVNNIIRDEKNKREMFLGDDKFFWDILKQQIISFTKEFSKEKASKLNKTYQECNRELEYLESLPQGKLSPYIIERIDSLQDKVNDYQRKKTRGALLR